MQAESHHGPTDPTGIPPWTLGELPEPKRLSWRNWRDFLGPGIVMMGIQIGGGEWLLGPAITAKYGGGLMWVATIAILLQVFYNMECGRYALYCGEPVLTGFMRCRPGPRFWVALM
ncbi:MAG: Nramp family divalent metal transporter, partial [Pirellulaceae bacterium]